MRRRDFIALTSSAAAAWAAIPPASRRAHAQGGVIPVIGFLSSRTPAQADYLVAAIRNGLSELGLVEGQNVAIEYRYADGHYERLPALAADLVDRRVAAIIAGGTSKPAIAAAKAVPIVFTTGYDPVSTGLVRSLNQPGDNVTGATFYSGALAAKQMQLLIEVAPKTVIFALLVNAESTGASSLVRDAETAVQTIGRELRVLNAGSEREIDAAFAALAKLPNSAMLIGVDPFFDSRPTQLVELAARYAKPVVYYLPEFVRLGGLMCYGASITDAYRQAGNYAGRIVKGEKPADLPVQLPTKFELSINLKTAKALGLTLPPTLLATATEIIE
jgi:putative ABC transport system substrate-binding protein